MSRDLLGIDRREVMLTCLQGGGSGTLDGLNDATGVWRLTPAQVGTQQTEGAIKTMFLTSGFTLQWGCAHAFAAAGLMTAPDVTASPHQGCSLMRLYRV